MNIRHPWQLKNQNPALALPTSYNLTRRILPKIESKKPRNSLCKLNLIKEAFVFNFISLKEDIKQFVRPLTIKAVHFEQVKLHM